MMKLFFLFLICALTGLSLNAQSSSFHSEGAPDDSTSSYNEYFYTPDIEAPVFRLFPIESEDTYIKLNTRNGQMWQVNIALRKGNSFENVLNSIPLVSEDMEENGRFILYPTQYEFILLDQLDGRMWQVQWSSIFRNSYVIPIE
jgi:hypothetical protein